MKIYELTIDALNPTNQTLEVPADSTIGFSVNINDKEYEIFDIMVFDNNKKAVKVEGFLTKDSRIPFYKYDSITENESEKYLVTYKIRKDLGIFTMSFIILFTSVNDGYSYKTTLVDEHINEKVATLERRMTNVENGIDTHAESIETKLDTANAGIEVLKTNTEGLKEPLNTIETKVDAIPTDIATLKTTTENVSQEVQNINVKLDAKYIAKEYVDEQNDSIKRQLAEI